MPTPMLDPKFTPTVPAPAAKKEESPLAGQLPAWNLVPAHTMLVRRRPAPPKPPQAPTATASSPSQAVSRTAAAAPAPATAVKSCAKCGAELESGSAFCTRCGNRA